MFLPRIFALLTFAPIFGFSESPSSLTTLTTCENGEILTVVNGGENKVEEAYIEGFKNYPDELCRPKRISDSLVEFRFPTESFRRCGTTRVINKALGTTNFYQYVTIISNGKEYRVFANCKSGVGSISANNELNSTTLIRRKKNVLPAGFREDENPITVEEKIGRAPEPILKMVVRQDGRVIGEELTVQPGSPLTVGVTLDSIGKDIYGILVSKMEVTDTLAQSETLVHNGCSVDPYLFENFLNDDGDLTAKFKAFKFPESNYVMFIATVNVCLPNCEGLSCSNGQIGYGRRKREIGKQSDFVIETSTILRWA